MSNGEHVLWHEKCTIGRKSYFNKPPSIEFWRPGRQLVVGDFCSIAKDCTFYLGGNHDVNAVSTYPFPQIFEHRRQELWSIDRTPDSKGNIVLKNDVWMGFNCTVMSGVTIGNGAVVAANSHVVKDVPDYAIVGGNPAKIIRYRFDKSQIEALLRIEWWRWPLKKIELNCHHLFAQDLKTFIELFDTTDQVQNNQQVISISN